MGRPRCVPWPIALCRARLMASGKLLPSRTRRIGAAGVAAGGQGFPAVSVQESGCGSVTGAGPVRSWSASSPFGQQLSEAVGGVAAGPWHAPEQRADRPVIGLHVARQHPPFSGG